LVERIKQVVDETGLDPSALRLEITESVLISSAPDVARQLHELRRLDIQLQIDDFGTGYSSLSYLYRFPIDALKIDRSFVSGRSSENTELLRAIVSLAHSLGMAAVGEGMETDEQMRRLAGINCDFAQGYLFSPPARRDSGRGHDGAAPVSATRGAAGCRNRRRRASL
jgi:EAL domain-containing protein (putative c-di-GMP-specific phosphodiesterase class I)